MKKKIIYFSFAGIVLFSLTFVGCKKQVSQVTPPTEVPSEKTIQTPFGSRPASQVHLVENGSHLQFKDNHLLKVQTASGKVVEDFGLQVAGNVVNNEAGPPKMTLGTPTNGNEIVPGQNSGWITYAQNNTPIPVSDFYVNWHIPTLPTTNNGQTLYIFSGLKDGLDPDSHILEPVLQYGDNGTFGGNYWTIDNWYASCSTCPVYYATPVSLDPGVPPSYLPQGYYYQTLLQGLIRQTAHTGSSYSYFSGFWGYSSYYLWVDNIPQLTYPVAGMEAYGMTQYTDYPQDLVCRMEGVSITTENDVPFTLNWTPYNIVTDVGQHTSINNGEADLYFHSYLPAPAINSAVSVIYSHTTTNGGIITASPGSTVWINVQSNQGVPSMSDSAVFYMTSPGVLLSGGSNTITVAQSSVAQSFTMPSTGFVTWSGYYIERSSGAPGYEAILVSY